ncbi:hypothetical protein [Pantoea sp. Mhis]|nr:hypothetical protein [Pantoea sp. Mhis]
MRLATAIIKNRKISSYVKALVIIGFNPVKKSRNRIIV